VVAPSPGKYKVTTQSSIDPLVPVAFDCSRIRQLGIDRQENLRAGAIMIHCGLAKGGGAPSHFGPLSSKVVQNLMAPLVFGGVDVDLITGTESFPNVTQSETFTTANPDDPTQVVVAYNDSRGRNFNPINISGASVSTDGGNTFTRLTKANGQSPFDDTFGDPVVLYHKPSGNWVTVWLDAACGGQGLGGYKSLTPDDPNSWTHFCAFDEGSADRESGWADNNPASPFFGRLYISWNDFNQPNANIFVISSTDGGSTWSSPVMVSTQATFVRDVQITGDLAGVYCIRSADGGVSFGTPVKLNTDSTTRPNWQPNLSVSPSGTLLATWYDARDSADTDCQYGNPASPCYKMYSRKSNDNGASWLPDDTLSDVISPLPAQPDAGIQTTYAGDYDYGSAITTKHVTSWTDGRVTISGTSQQDAFTDRDLVGFSVATA